MLTPSQPQLLDLWDLGSRATPWGRAGMLLRAAWPDADVAQWSLGQVNARLLEFRAALFGHAWGCVADCPACAQVADVHLDVAAILAAAPAYDAAPTPAWHRIDGAEADHALRFRLPVLADLVGAHNIEGLNASRLLQAIVADAPDPSAAGWADVVELQPQARAAIEQRLQQLDPLAAIDIVVDCPACGHRWRAAADVVGMVWAELSVLAKRLLGDVARLAGVFGWSEQQILALTPQRRQHYLDMVREW